MRSFRDRNWGSRRGARVRWHMCGGEAGLVRLCVHRRSRSGTPLCSLISFSRRSASIRAKFGARIVPPTRGSRWCHSETRAGSVRHRSKKRRAFVRNSFAYGVSSCVTRNAPNGNAETAVSCQQKQRRKCAPLPWSCLAVFVEVAGGNRVRCFSTIDLVVIINHTGRFERVFAHARAHTTARPHDRTTARPHECATAP